MRKKIKLALLKLYFNLDIAVHLFITYKNIVLKIFKYKMKNNCAPEKKLKSTPDHEKISFNTINNSFNYNICPE